jgi:hypothetical protein
MLTLPAVPELIADVIASSQKQAGRAPSDDENGYYCD